MFLEHSSCLIRSSRQPSAGLGHPQVTGEDTRLREACLGRARGRSSIGLPEARSEEASSARMRTFPRDHGAHSGGI